MCRTLLENAGLGAEQVKISVGNCKLDAQIVCIDQLHDTFTRVDTLIIFHKTFFDGTVEGSRQFSVAHIIDG